MVEIPRLYTLKEASQMTNDTITVRVFRAAIHDGRLPWRKIGKYFYLTLAEIERFMCPDPASPPGSTSGGTKSNSSSATVTSKSGQAMALSAAARLKRHSRTTSPAASRPPGEVQPIRRT
jgi:hypothetical protein